ncbi:hypothetical protein Y032_0405g869 [Ancylostoma ceylanicum]|uniref:Uncharacterized protein n=1 Tax=Ancylostoma ceylanicum TaxID=53326 RepID=A0A016X4L9_9BILA|nr:hypothetical protein Y032_0405g869 [Ancylostoma ceylanicum]
MPPANHCIGHIRIQRLYDAQMKSNAWHIHVTGFINADHFILFILYREKMSPRRWQSQVLHIPWSVAAA